MHGLRTIGIAAVVGTVVGLSSPLALAASPSDTNAMAAAPENPDTRAPHPGDTVRLRSGSPLMTVQSIEGDKANCFWTTDDGEVSTGAIPVVALVVVGGPGWLPSNDEP